jgi:hypothetical protein
MQGDRIELGAHASRGQQRRQRRGEPQRPRDLGEVQRLDAEPVAREDEASGVVLVEREREHPGEALDTAMAPLGMGPEYHLGIARRREAMARARELAPKLVVVVDAAVEDDRRSQLGVDHRLGARAGRIDDLQAPVSQRDASARPRARAVRAAVAHRRGDALDGVAVGRSTRRELAGEAAHDPVPAAQATREDRPATSSDRRSAASERWSTRRTTLSLPAAGDCALGHLDKISNVRPPRGGGPLPDRFRQSKRTLPLERALACARSTKSRRLVAALKRRVASRRRAFSERRSSRPCLASRPKSTVAAIS